MNERRQRVLTAIGLVLAGTALASAAPPADRPFLHGLFQSAMMFQRDVPCPVWGWTEPGAPVTVAVNGQTNNALCNLYNGDGLPAVPFRTESR